MSPRSTLLATLLLAAAAPLAAQTPAAPGQLSGSSSYRLLPRSASCSFGYRVRNLRYTVVGSLYSQSLPPHLVLEESTTLEQCENLEGPAVSEVSVVARPAGRPAAAPLWTIRRRGERGEVVDSFPGQPVYRITEYGCCGSENVDAWYSLASGHLLFTADYPLLSLELQPFGTGLLGVHDGEAASSPRGAGDSTTLAVISFGRVGGVVQHLGLRGPSRDFVVRQLEWVARGPAGQVQRAQRVDEASRLGAGWSVAASFTLESTDDGTPRGRVEIPVSGGALQPIQARITGPFRLFVIPR
jgi:hypothetical protein